MSELHLGVKRSVIQNVLFQLEKEKWIAKGVPLDYNKAGDGNEEVCTSKKLAFPRREQ